MNLLHPKAGTVVTRMSLGIVLLAHSIYLKLAVFGLPGTAQFFQSIGLPGVLAYVVFAIEASAGIALVVGYRVRVAAISVVPVLLGATWAHWQNGWLFSNGGGGWEYPLLLTALAISQALSGSEYPAVGDRRDQVASRFKEEVST